MRAARRFVLIVAAAVAVAWTAARGVAPTPADDGGPQARSEPAVPSSAGAPSPAAEATSRPSDASAGVAPASGRQPLRLAPAVNGGGGRASAWVTRTKERGTDGVDGIDAGADHAGSSAAWPSLDPVARVPGAATVTVEGRDPAAPRALVLWRIVAGRAARLVCAESTSDGRVSFGEVSLPRGALEFAVTPSGVAAEVALAAPRTTIGPAEGPAPQVEAQADGSDTWRLRVRTETPGGWLVVSTRYGVEIGRLPVPAAPSAARSGFDLWIDDVGTIGTVLVAHDDPETGRSAWRRVALTAQDAGGEGR